MGDGDDPSVDMRKLASAQEQALTRHPCTTNNPTHGGGRHPVPLPPAVRAPNPSATLVVAALEGAVAMCRAKHNTKPLDHVAEQLQVPITSMVGA